MKKSNKILAGLGLATMMCAATIFGGCTAQADVSISQSDVDTLISGAKTYLEKDYSEKDYSDKLDELKDSINQIANQQSVEKKLKSYLVSAINTTYTNNYGMIYVRNDFDIYGNKTESREKTYKMIKTEDSIVESYSSSYSINGEVEKTEVYRELKEFGFFSIPSENAGEQEIRRVANAYRVVETYTKVDETKTHTKVSSSIYDIHLFEEGNPFLTINGHREVFRAFGEIFNPNNDHLVSGDISYQINGDTETFSALAVYDDGSYTVFTFVFVNGEFKSFSKFSTEGTFDHEESYTMLTNVESITFDKSDYPEAIDKTIQLPSDND